MWQFNNYVTLKLSFDPPTTPPPPPPPKDTTILFLFKKIETHSMQG